MTPVCPCRRAGPHGETSREAIDLISAHQDQELYIAFDHDLGDDDETKFVLRFMLREGIIPAGGTMHFQQWPGSHLARTPD